MTTYGGNLKRIVVRTALMAASASSVLSMNGCTKDVSYLPQYQTWVERDLHLAKEQTVSRMPDILDWNGPTLRDTASGAGESAAYLAEGTPLLIASVRRPNGMDEQGWNWNDFAVIDVRDRATGKQLTVAIRASEVPRVIAELAEPARSAGAVRVFRSARSCDE